MNCPSFPSGLNHTPEGSTVRGVEKGGTTSASSLVSSCPATQGNSAEQWYRKTLRLRGFTGKGAMYFPAGDSPTAVAAASPSMSTNVPDHLFGQEDRIETKYSVKTCSPEMHVEVIPYNCVQKVGENAQTYGPQAFTTVDPATSNTNFPLASVRCSPDISQAPLPAGGGERSAPSTDPMMYLTPWDMDYVEHYGEGRQTYNDMSAEMGGIGYERGFHVITGGVWCYWSGYIHLSCV